MKLGTESFTARTSSESTVKGETSRLQGRNINSTIDAGHGFRKENLGAIDHRHGDQSLGHADSMAHRVFHSVTELFIDEKPVDDDVDAVILPLIQVRRVLQRDYRAINTDPDKSFSIVLFE